MLITIFIILLVIYSLLALISLNQVKKIIKKYQNYPHFDNLPKDWQGFIRNDKHKWNKSQLIKGCFIKFPFKFFLFFQYIFICFIFIIITLPFGSQTCNKFLRYYGRFYGSYIFKCLYSINEPSKINFKRISTPIVISNHVCWFDTMYLMVTFYPISFLAKQQVRKIPIIKTIANNAQSIYIDRNNSNQRKSIIDKIKQRVNTFIIYNQNQQYDKVYPIIIFPEGTTSNGNALLKFKLGAFNELAPITLIALKYKCDNFDVGMVQITQLQHIIISFCLSVNLKVQLKEISALQNQKPQQYSLRAQLELSKMTGFKIYSSGYRERVEHQTQVNNCIKQMKNKSL